MSPNGVLVYTLTLITLVAAVDTAVALFLSSNCATAEKPFLVLPGSDILSGNCVDDLVIDYLAPDWKSIQVISLSGDCSVHAYYDKSCDGPVAQVNANECVLFDSKPAEAIGISDGVPIRSFRIDGGDCKLPSKAVLSTSADVPAASSTRTADSMSTVISTNDGSFATTATSQTTLNFGSYSGTSTIKEFSSTPTSTRTPSSDGTVQKHDPKLSTLLLAITIPIAVICASFTVYFWRRRLRRRQDERQRKDERRGGEEHKNLGSIENKSSQQTIEGNTATDYAQQYSGNKYKSNVFHFHYGSGGNSPGHW